MKAQQIVYTSCRKGIESSVSGFQNYSYSPGIKDWINTDSIGVLQSYQPPRIEGLPSLPTKDEAQSLYPKRQVLGRIQGPDSLYGFALCSYIGRDYPEGSVRGGNFISHVLVLPANQIDQYPCTFIDSPSFRTWMDAETARKEEQPQPLNPVEIQQNPNITIDAVSQFLNDGDNGEIFSQLLRCLLSRNNGSVPSKLLIYDTPENFTMWVSALQMALPLRQALDFNVSFYEYDMNVAGIDVLRMSEGMKQGSNDPDLANHFVIDVDNGILPDLPDADDGIGMFCDFALTALQYAPENLKDFHEFLNATTLTAADEHIGLAYRLYQIDTGTENINGDDHAPLSDLLEFAKTYASDAQRSAFVDQILQTVGTEVLTDDDRTVLQTALPELTKDVPILHNVIPQRLLASLFNIFTTVGSQRELFDQVHQIAQAVFKVLGRSCDSELFANITKQDTTVYQPGSVGVPWTASMYAQLAVASLISDVSRGLDIPDHGDARQRLLKAGPLSSQAIDRVIDAIVANVAVPFGNTTVGLSLFETVSQQAAVQPEILELIGQLVLQCSPVSKPLHDAVISSIWPVFRGLNDSGRYAVILSLVASGLDQIAKEHLIAFAQIMATAPRDYYQFLVRLLPLLPVQFSQRYSPDLVQACWGIRVNSVEGQIESLQCIIHIPGATLRWVSETVSSIANALPVAKITPDSSRPVRELLDICARYNPPLQAPARLVLAQHLLRIEELADKLSTSRSNPTVIESLYAAIQQNGSWINTAELGREEQKEYIQRISSQVARVVCRGQKPLILQGLALPRNASTVAQYVIAVVISQKDLDDIILLLAYDSEWLFGTPTVEPKVGREEFATFVAHRLFESKVRLSSMDKQVTDANRFVKQQARYEQRSGKRFPSSSFAKLYGSVQQKLEEFEENKPSLLGRIFR